MDTLKFVKFTYPHACLYHQKRRKRVSEAVLTQCYCGLSKVTESEAGDVIWEAFTDSHQCLAVRLELAEITPATRPSEH